MTPAPWNTPQILKAGLVAVCVASLLFMVAAVTGARSHRYAMQVIGKDSGPGIIAAQQIGSVLADMDALAATELLDPADAAYARGAFESRGKQAAEAIVSAAQNIRYGDAGRVPILKLAAGIQTYVARVQEARDLRTARDVRFIDAYREAADYMDKVLLASAGDLDRANRAVLEQTYSEATVASGLSIGFLIVSALLLLWPLIWLQIFLARRMRRILNPMLLLATALTFVFAVYAAQAFSAERRELKTAKEDTFESIAALLRARSLAYGARGDESRYLLDPAHAAVYEKSFAEKTNRIATLPEGETRAQILSDLTNGRRVNGFTGYLADEFNHLSFPGERENAVDTLNRFAEYLRNHRKIETLEGNKSHSAAVALCVGENPGQPIPAFASVDEAITSTLVTSEQAFDASVKRGMRDVNGFEVSSPLTAFVVAGLAALGLRPGFREYSG